MADFLIAVFFVTALNIFGFDIAMKATMSLAAVVIIVEHLMGKRFNTFQWVAYATIFLFGIPSLIWKNPLIFQHKITIIYTFFALTLMIYPFFAPQTIIEILFPDVFLKDSYIWINRWLVLIFLNGAVMNASAIKYLSLKNWGIFKIGLIIYIMMLIFLIFYYFLLEKSNYEHELLHRQHEPEDAAE